MTIKKWDGPKTWPKHSFCAWRIWWWYPDKRRSFFGHRTSYSGKAHHWRIWRIGFDLDTRLSDINRLWPWWPWPLLCRFGRHRWEDCWPYEDGVKVCRCGKRGYTDWRAFMDAKEIRELEEA